MKIHPQLYAEVEKYVRDVLKNQLPEGYAYHNLEHTEQVVDMVEKIAETLDLEKDEILLLKIAAWFHDLGYITTYLGHEEESMRLACEFLTQKKAPKQVCSLVSSLIEATKLDQEPRTTLEKVIKDADLFNLATPDALENSQKIRHEWKVFCNRDFSDAGWQEFNYNFFKNYEYYTAYGKEFFAPQKSTHVRTLKKAIKKRKKKELTAARALMEFQLDEQENQIERLNRKLKKIQKQRPDRGIETMFRTTYRTHMNLSSIADNKANILLSINAIIISIVFTEIIKTFEDNDMIVYPGVAIMMVCLATIVYAILATRPKVNSGIFSREDILAKKTNLLFFGNFHRMDVDDYLWGMKEMMKDAEYLYGSMSKDIYFLGRVLAKKFQYLRIAYNIFMYGIGICVVIFGVILLMMKIQA